MDIDWITVLVYAGLALVLLGPALGTYIPIRKARTPAARRFLIRMSVLMWLLLLAVGVVPILLVYHGVIPSYATWAPFLIFGVLFAIPWMNRRVTELEAGASSS
jgi:hypothetical protein